MTKVFFWTFLFMVFTGLALIPLKSGDWWIASMPVGLALACLGVCGLRLRTALQVLTGEVILEFSSEAIIDRRTAKPRKIRYDEIEIFSPPLEDLFHVPKSLEHLRLKLGLENSIVIAARLKDQPRFMFCEHVAPIEESDAAKIKAALRSRLKAFDHLVDV